MARMSAEEFIKYCNDSRPSWLRDITRQDLDAWSADLQPEKILRGEFYYPYHYFTVLNLLNAKKDLAEKPEREQAEKERKEAKARKRKEAQRQWQIDHSEERKIHNKRYYLTKKLKNNLISQCEYEEQLLLLKLKGDKLRETII